MIRPGRVDVKVALGFADSTQIEKHFLNFYPEASAKQAAKFASELKGAELSMAHVQGHFLTNKNNPEVAIATAKNLKSQASPL